MNTPATAQDPWADCIARLSSPFGTLTLRTQDGHIISARVAWVRMRLIIIIAVDGEINTAWLNGCAQSLDELSREGRRYYQVKTRKVWPKKYQRTKADTRAMRAAGLDPDARFYHLSMSWTSAAACIRHLRKSNPGLTIIDPDAAAPAEAAA